MSIVRVVPVLVILGNCSVPANIRGDYCYVFSRNGRRRHGGNGIVRTVGMLAKKRVIYFGTLALEKQSRFTKVTNCLFSMSYRATLVTLVLNQYLTKVRLSN
jgi:hypothetical protein